MLMSTSLDATITNLKYHVTNTNFVKNNVRIIDFHKNWNVLLYIYKGTYNKRTETNIK